MLIGGRGSQGRGVFWRQSRRSSGLSSGTRGTGSGRLTAGDTEGGFLLAWVLAYLCA